MLSDEELAHAAPMTLVHGADASADAPMIATAMLNLRRVRKRWVLEEHMPPHIFTIRASDPGYVTQIRLLETIPAEMHSPNVKVELVGPRGTRSAGGIFGQVQDGDGTDGSIEAHFAVEPDIERVRFLIDGEVIYEVTLTTDPPKLEALVLGTEPQRVAFRIDGATHATHYHLFQWPEGKDFWLWSDSDTILPGRAGIAPCWHVLFLEPRAQADRSLPLLLNVESAFDGWRLQAPWPAADASKTSQ